MGYTENETMYPKKGDRERGERKGEREEEEGRERKRRNRTTGSGGTPRQAGEASQLPALMPSRAPGTRKGAVLLQSAHPFLLGQCLSLGGT